MPQKTELSLLALPGMIHSFSPKAAAEVEDRRFTGTITVVPKFAGTVANEPKYAGTVANEPKYEGTIAING